MALFHYEFNSLSDLFIHELKDLYDAQYRLTEALPDLADAASSPELKQAFHMHLQQTRNQIQRLEEVFHGINIEPDRESCHAMKGIIDEGGDIISAKGNDKVRDAGLIAAAQRAEHYEIAGYGTVCAFAHQLGRDDLAQVLHLTLEEQSQADKKLTRLAESHINPQAQA